MNEHTKDKQEVSSLTWLFGFAVSWFISWQVVKSIYELNDSTLNDSGLVAIGAVMAIIYFSLTSKASLNKVGRGLLMAGIFLYGIIVIPVEIFSLFANNMSNSGGEELSQIREVKEAGKKEQLRLEAKEVEIMKGVFTKGDRGLLLARNGEALKLAKADAHLIIPSNQGKVFGDLSGWLGVENIEPIYKTIVAALLVFVMPLLNIARNGTWCGLTLLMYKAQSWFLGWVMEEKPAQTKTATKPAVDIKGTQETKPMDSSTFDRDFKAACDWVRGHKVGQRVFVGKMKAACKGGANWQHEAILNGLKSDGILQKKDNNGTSPLYYRKEAKQQVNLRDTFKPFKLVK